MHSHTRRREFLKTAAVLASTSMVHSSCSAEPVLTAQNGRIQTALIGVGERGKYLVANLPAAFQVTAVCDCSLDQIGTLKQPPKRFGELLAAFVAGDLQRCRFYQDYRRMFDKQKFDAVIISTADHHHALAAILAMQAGAHVYVEKPLAVTIGEGRAMVEAASRFRKIVQVGSQQRSMEVNRIACEFVRGGGLGKIRLVEERNYPGPMPYNSQKFSEQDVPRSLQWDLFCGPTPLRAYNRRLWVKDAFDYGYLRWRGWDLFEDYSGHLMTNWGAHGIDMIQYALGKDGTGPVRVEPLLKDVDDWVDDQWHLKTPPLGSLQQKDVDRARYSPLLMEYADGTKIHFKPGTRKTIFYGEKGIMRLSRNNYSVEPLDLLPPPDPIEQQRWKGTGNVARPHLENWLDAIKAGGSLNAPIEVGHRTASICHLANIARRLRRSLDWDPHNERFIDDADADAWLDRPRRRGFELPT